MGYQSFRELRVWQKAKDLAVDIYQMTNKGVLTKDYDLRGQIRKAAVSIAANIAEGYERHSNREFIRFLLMAKGSLSELETHLEIACGIGYVDRPHFQVMNSRFVELGSMITRLIQARRDPKGKRSNGVQD